MSCYLKALCKRYGLQLWSLSLLFFSLSPGVEDRAPAGGCAGDAEQQDPGGRPAHLPLHVCCALREHQRRPASQGTHALPAPLRLLCLNVFQLQSAQSFCALHSRSGVGVASSQNGLLQTFEEHSEEFLVVYRRPYLAWGIRDDRVPASCLYSLHLVRLSSCGNRPSSS